MTSIIVALITATPATITAIIALITNKKTIDWRRFQIKLTIMKGSSSF